MCAFKIKWKEGWTARICDPVAFILPNLIRGCLTLHPRRNDFQERFSALKRRMCAAY